jgi:hypothetical protein
LERPAAGTGPVVDFGERLRDQESWDVPPAIFMYHHAFSQAIAPDTPDEKRAACKTVMEAAAPAKHSRQPQRAYATLADLIREALDDRINGLTRSRSL